MYQSTCHPIAGYFAGDEQTDPPQRTTRKKIIQIHIDMKSVCAFVGAFVSALCVRFVGFSRVSRVSFARFIEISF